MSAVALTPPASTETDNEVIVSPQGEAVTPTEAEAADLQAIARAEGIAFDEAVVRFSGSIPDNVAQYLSEVPVPVRLASGWSVRSTSGGRGGLVTAARAT